MKVESYGELEAYRKAYKATILIYHATREFPKEETYGIISQLRRAAVSVVSNIAEGYMRGSKEYIQFLKMALGSCAELETQLSLSIDLGFGNKDTLNEIYNLNEEAIKLLRTYIKKLSLSV